MNIINSSRFLEQSQSSQIQRKGQESSTLVSGSLFSDSCTFRKSNNQIYETDRSLSNCQNDDRKDWMESIQRRFQLQLQKEKQLSSIINSKLQQQVEYLKLQNQTLKSKVNSQKIQIDNLTIQIQSSTFQQNTYLVNPQTATKLKTMLQTLQQEHEHCIQLKKDLLNTIETHQIKIKLLLNQNKQLQNQNKLLQKQLKDTQNQTRSLNELQSQNEHYKKQVQSMKKQISSLKCVNHHNKLQFNNQLQELHKSIQSLERHNQIEENSLKLRDAEKQNIQQNTFLGIKNVEKQTFQSNQCQTFQKIDLNQKQIIQQLYKKSLLSLNKNQSSIMIKSNNFNINSQNENITPKYHQIKRFKYI